MVIYHAKHGPIRIPIRQIFGPKMPKRLGIIAELQMVMQLAHGATQRTQNYDGDIVVVHKTCEYIIQGPKRN